MESNITGYELSRMFWDFSFANPEKIKPYHSAIYFFAIEYCNRLGWKDKFGFPTSIVLEATGIKSYSAYKRYLDDLVEWELIIMIEYSKNQHTSNIIALTLKAKAHGKALDKALVKQSESNYSIIKQVTSKPLTKENPFKPKQIPKKKPVNTTTEFYKKQIEDNTGEKLISKYKNFVEYINGKNDAGIIAENLLKIKTQLTYDQFVKLINKNIVVLDYVDSYTNKGYKGNESIYLTFLGWHRKNSK